ncbi:hypothetical protein E8E01_15010 [Methylorubrum populi]|uniref:hypothetical protein n=1 Tax=Methylorubrum populi TaxID=223967 RepID=UPI0011547E44|nr:hypothetical protein [Methylorubrum populi]QDI81660.1 hypothetical protein E8E01_15010 [Methylorubrum populi]
MLALAQDFLAAGLALAAYAAGALLAFGRCQRLALPLIRPAQPLSPPHPTTTRPAMSAPRPAAEPLNVNSISVAVGMAVLLLGSGVSLVACLRINGWL